MIRLDVRPPGRDPWTANIPWEKIIRIVFKTAESFLDCDEIYIFTSERPESHLIPMEAGGALELWNEIVRRNLFPAELSITASTTSGQMFVWPPVEKDEQPKKEAKKTDDAPTKVSNEKMKHAVRLIRDDVVKAKEALERILAYYGGKFSKDDSTGKIWGDDTKEAYLSLDAAWQMLYLVVEGDTSYAEKCKGFINMSRGRLGQALSELEALKDEEASNLKNMFGLACERALNDIDGLLRKIIPPEPIKAPESRIVIKGPREAELLCEVCGKVSMTFKDGDFIGKQRFLFSGTTHSCAVDEGDIKKIMDLLDKNDVAGLHELVQNLSVALEDGLDGYCPKCDKVYCRDHIHMEVVWDDGFYDCTYGTCPMGHKRMIDD